MDDNEQFLRETAKLLIACERELLALRRKHQRLSSWLGLAQLLPELVDPQSELAEISERVSRNVVSALDLQIAAFFVLTPAGELSPILNRPKPAATRTLGRAAWDLVRHESNGVCQEPTGEALTALADAFGLYRFLWHRMDFLGADLVLFVAGFDRQRAEFHAIFDEADVSHFRNTGRQLGLLLSNRSLVKELAHDKQKLEQFNVNLERLVVERTRELAGANEELAVTLSILKQKDRRLAEDIEQARLFQQKILPALPTRRGLEFGVAYRPLESVGGDIFDVCELSPGRFRVLIADATGHGVQAAMRTILIKAEYDQLKADHAAPHTALSALSQRLFGLFPEREVLCTGCCFDIELDATGARVAYTNAANPPLLHWSAGSLTEIHAEGPFVAVDRSDWPEPVVFRMAKGDALLAYSDGLSEQTNLTGVIFESQFKLTDPGSWASAADGASLLLRDFDAFRGEAPLSDDVTLVVMRLPDGVTA